MKLGKILTIIKIITSALIFAYLAERFGITQGIIGVIIYLLILVAYSIIINWQQFKESYLMILEQTETVIFGKPIKEHEKGEKIVWRKPRWKKKKNT